MASTPEDNGAKTVDSSKPDEKVCYYELLGVEKTATQDQIRKAYLRASLKWHPDKNRDNPEAEAVFKEISEAYGVLSDESRRERYDKFGFEAAKEMDIDPEELFEQMFGTRDPVEAFKKIMADPDLRGPVILGTGLAATVAGVATTIHGIKNKKGGSAALTAVGGLAGTLGGLTLAVGGAATWLVDAGIQGAKKGVKALDEKIDEVKDDIKKTRERQEADKKAAQSGLQNCTDQTRERANNSKSQPSSPSGQIPRFGGYQAEEAGQSTSGGGGDDRLYPDLTK